MTKPREFWLHDLLYWHIDSKPEPPYFDGYEPLHVIEYSAYQEKENTLNQIMGMFDKSRDNYEVLQSKAEKLAAALEAVKAEVKCGPDSSFEDVAYYIAEQALAEYRGETK